MNEDTIKDQLRENGTEYRYHGESCQMSGGVRNGHMTVDDFYVAPSDRDKGVASTVLGCLIDVLQANGVTKLTLEMGATDEYTIDELDRYRDAEDAEDDTERFLRKHDFQQIGVEKSRDFGTVFIGTKEIYSNQ